MTMINDGSLNSQEGGRMKRVMPARPKLSIYANQEGGVTIEIDHRAYANYADDDEHDDDVDCISIDADQIDTVVKWLQEIKAEFDKQADE